LPPTALALVGFSQGTMMALHVGLRRAARRRRSSAIRGCWCCRRTAIPSASPRRSNRARRCSWCTATSDELIPPQALFQATQGLAALGVPVEWHLSAGVGHGIDPEGPAPWRRIPRAELRRSERLVTGGFDPSALASPGTRFTILSRPPIN
jgi:phospholipase/carboxylesterase